VKERIAKIKQHVKDNKQIYISCGVTGVVAVIGTLLLVDQKGSPQIVTKAIGWRPRAETNHVTVTLIERSTPSKPVHLKGTSLYFNSLSEAARETGHDLSAISRQINGHSTSVKGDVFEILEHAAS